MASPRFAIKLKRLRQRFGIGAPKLAIKPHVAWYWYLLLLPVLALLFWSVSVYQAERRASALGAAAPSQETVQLVGRIAWLEHELARLRSQGESAESSRKIEQATQRKLLEQVTALEAENSALKEDLAVFEDLLPASGVEAGGNGIKIHRLRVERENKEGQYRYRLLLTRHAARGSQDFVGSLQLLVQIWQGGKDVMITLPADESHEAQAFAVRIKSLQRAEGVFSLPKGALLKRVEVRVLQNGLVSARRSATL
ncbi:MAG: DUF6776 family protein [Pseudomonadota bacterium]